MAKKALREALLDKTFQSPRNVQRAIQMAGKSSPGPWSRLATSVVPGSTVDSFEKRLGQIVHRRNCIVHESDYRRLDRPRDAGTEPITSNDLLDALEVLERVIDGIHAL